MASESARGVVERLGIAAVERRLGIDRSTLWRWYRSGRFPEPEYLGELRLWRVDVIEEWERERLSRPPSARRGARNLTARARAVPSSSTDTAAA